MLKEKIAVVTGFSRGLGFDISREFAQRGAAVSMFSRNTAGVPYGIGKSGVIAIIKHIALEYGNKNIRAYTLALCNICTDATFRSMSVTERKKGSMENSMKRWGHRRELATIAVSVASKDSGFATRNKIIVVEGGTVML